MAPVGFALNGFHWILLFLAWVGTCVSFGGILHTNSNGGEFKYYYDHVTGPNGYNEKYSNIQNSSDADKCMTGGRGFVAMQVFAFLALLFALIIVTLRILGKQSIIPQFTSPAATVRAELILTSIALFFYFLAVCIWGGTCFKVTKDLVNSDVAATGYAFVIVDFFFLILDVILLCIILKNSMYQLGAGGGVQEPKHMQHTDQPQVNAHPGEMQHQGQTFGDPNLVELTCPSCAAKVTCPRGGQTNCAVCDAEISA